MVMHYFHSVLEHGLPRSLNLNHSTSYSTLPRIHVSVKAWHAAQKKIMVFKIRVAINLCAKLEIDRSRRGLDGQQNLLATSFIWLVLCLPKYISVKLLHASSGLPYVKDRLLSCAARTLDIISKNPFVQEPITFNSTNPGWDRFPTPLSVIRPVSL